MDGWSLMALVVESGIGNCLIKPVMCLLKGVEFE